MKYKQLFKIFVEMKLLNQDKITKAVEVLWQHCHSLKTSQLNQNLLQCFIQHCL